MVDQPMIRYDSPEAASFQTGLSGWVSRDGHFWGNDEHMARWSGATHLICKDCGSVYLRSSWCDACRHNREQAKFLAMPEIPHSDAEYPLCVFDDDKFFWDEDGLLEHLADLGADAEHVQIITTRPGHLHTVESDTWCDDLPEDGELPDDVAKKLDELNVAIKAAAPVCWWPSDKRVNVAPLLEQLAKEQQHG